MSPDTTTWRAFRPVVLRRGLAVAAILSLSFGVGGCAIGNAIKAVHAIANAAGNLKNLESQIQKGENDALMVVKGQFRWFADKTGLGRLGRASSY